MLIDWFTVGAQVLNFIVLVWLLKHFLYKPVLNAIDAREKRVAAELTNAAQQMTEIKKSRDELQAKGNAFDAERAALLAKAILDAKTETERLLGVARQAADALTLQRNAALHGETARLSDDLSRLAAAESINIARAALKDLAGADLESVGSSPHAGRLVLGIGCGCRRRNATSRNRQPSARLGHPPGLDLRRDRNETDFRGTQSLGWLRSLAKSQSSRLFGRNADRRLGGRTSDRDACRR